MDIVVNGEPRQVADGTTVLSFLSEIGLPQTRVAVERNRGLVRKPDYGTTLLSDGDRLEIVTFVGGG
jgi:thiamine biosynthesis protein ThiS